jgi:hypothetical protein
VAVEKLHIPPRTVRVRVETPQVPPMMVRVKVLPASPLKMTRRRVAFHEAGHAVAAQRFGLDSFGATIVPSEAASGQHVGSGWYDLDERGRARFITCLLAGYAAEVKLGGDEKSARAGAGSDFEHVEDIRRHLDDPKTLGHWLARARAFVNRPRNWRAIEWAAKELLRLRELRAKELSIMLDVVDGRSPPNSLEKFRRAFMPERLLKRGGA